MTGGSCAVTVLRLLVWGCGIGALATGVMAWPDLTASTAFLGGGAALMIVLGAVHYVETHDIEEEE